MTIDETWKERRERKREDARREEQFSKVRNAERSFGAALRGYARQITHIIGYHATTGETPIVPPEKMPELSEALRRYSAGTIPWARATVGRMISEVNRRSLTAWRTLSGQMSVALRKELNSAPIGEAVAGLLTEQVELITSLPIEAARRVQEQTQEALLVGSRYPERVAEIEQALAEAHPTATGIWLAKRADLIAVTETARSASVLVQARATHIGADKYIWKAVMDWKTRPTHRELNGSVQEWSNPPLSDLPDYHSHPGQIFRCRCVALPIIPG